MPVSPRGRYQRREPVEQLVVGEQHADFAARAGFLALINQMLRVELTPPFLGKRGAGAPKSTSSVQLRGSFGA